ncbi:class III extradiol ring-cleavage dioxygenase [Paenibacillus sp. MMS20-IR301]|uniref:DODA-type extradiol aromatic ring-opening family dioxygenase n=1 Tax=Paenibacillus sp. MMS20-IR301 TaxID=2895946 RepID=UPI0028E613AC|nr:class III extradiol ring-cleavage dioxygenase [Paenibacillus sp. MMS20-IR301]WNS43136.1 class III extradiol ring-cleavage dioxygenase [Paenibacillus sp. MMS20-IR301]
MIPSYFFAHGAPSIVLEDNDYTKLLKEFKDHAPRPKAIVVFSAHWEEAVQSVGAAAEYETIYDFGGFQDELYQMTYPARSNREVVEQIQSLFDQQGIMNVTDERRGLDHGVWAVLKLLYPEADIPVIALSVDRDLPNEQQYQIGKALAKLREQDVLIIGSGGTVHNLRKLNWRSEAIDSWAEQFDSWVQDKLESWDTEALFKYRERAPRAAEAVPTSEHFIPLLLAMGAGDANRSAKLLHRSYQYGNLSLSCWQFN